MSKRVQRRRGTAAEHTSGTGFTGEIGEITVDTTANTIRIHDGTTKGGHPLSRADASNLDLTNKINVNELNLAEGTNGQVLSTNGAGTISFTNQPDVSASVVGGDISGTVGNAQIVANSVGVTELNVSAGTAGQALTITGAGALLFADVVTDPTVGGDLSGTTSNAQIVANAVGAAEIATNSVSINELNVADGAADTYLKTDGAGNLSFAAVSGGGAGSSTFEEDIFTGDGSSTTFTLSTVALTEENILVFIDGVSQPTSAYTLPSTTSLGITPAPYTGASIKVLHLGIAQQSAILDNTITGAKIAMGFDAAGDVLYYNGTDYARLGIGTSGQHLVTNSGATAPEWATTYMVPAPGTTGNVLTSDGTNWTSATSSGSGSGIAAEHILVNSSWVGATRRGVWTKTAGVTQIEVFVIGSGGHGGINHSGAGQPAGGNGGTGGWAKRIIDVTNITSLDWELGYADANLQSARTTFGMHHSIPNPELTVNVDGSGAITTIALSGSGGGGITLPPVIIINPNATSVTGRDGTGATATATISGGVVTGITVTNGGSGYVAGQVRAFMGIGATGGHKGNQGANYSPNNPGIGYGDLGNYAPNIMAIQQYLPTCGGSGSGQPSTGGGSSRGGNGGIYIREYR